MPLTFSIANGIALGLVSWTSIHALSGRPKAVHPALYGLTVAIHRPLCLAGWRLNARAPAMLPANTHRKANACSAD